MTIPNNKETKALLIILEGFSSRVTKLSKLSRLSIECDDPRIKMRCEALSAALRASGAGDHLPTFIKGLQAQPTRTVGQDSLVHAFTVISDFCKQELASTQPQWQRIALAAGWTPPSPAA